MTYNYVCNDCKEEFIIEKGINEEIETKCPKCNSKNVKRIFSVPVFKNTMKDCFGKSK